MRTQKILLIALFALFLGCSKEKRLEIRLKGTWNIDKWTITDYLNYSPSVYSLENVGHFAFSKNGQGSLTTDYLGYYEKQSLTWYVLNADPPVLVVKIAGDAQQYDIVESSRKNMKLSGEYWNSPGNGSEDLMMLSKE